VEGYRFGGVNFVHQAQIDGDVVLRGGDGFGDTSTESLMVDHPVAI
jgi:PII-like signaling protein